MRTKTLLLTAAAVVAGIVSAAKADTVLSQNVVGYINITIAPGSFYFLGNQLTNAGSANDINLVLTNGVVSDANQNSNTVAFIWNPSTTSYAVYQYYNLQDASDDFGASQAGWYDAGGNLASAQLVQGAGNFIKNAWTSPITLTLVGQVPQGSNSIAVLPGFNTYSIVPPVVTNIDSALLNFPGQSDVNQITNDTYFLFNPGNGSYTTLQYYNAQDANDDFGSPVAGWYDAGGFNHDSDPLTYPGVGQAFFIFHPANTTNHWNYSFQVQ